MADQMDYLERIAAAERFKQFGASEETQHCLDALEGQFTETWATTDKPEIAHELWHRVRAVRQIRSEIQAKVDDGKIATAEMKRDGDYQKRAEAAKPLSRSKRKAS